MEPELTAATVSAATAFAARGEHDLATALLREVDTSGSADAAVLEARIAAQQRRYDAAIAAFERALAITPGHAAAEAGLARARALHRSAVARLRPSFALAGVVVGSVVLTWGVAAFLPGRVEVPAPTVPRPEVPAVAAERPAQAPSLPAIVGVSSTPMPPYARLVFDEGLFSDGTDQLLPGARDRLDATGRVLAGRSDLRVEVEGHTDGRTMKTGAAFKDNGALAIARAVVAAGRLRETSGLPASAFTLRGRGPEQAPHNVASGNRTVVLLVAQQTPDAGR